MKLFINRIIIVALAFVFLNCNRDPGCNKNTKKDKNSDRVDTSNVQMVKGACMNIPTFFPIGHTVTGKQANGFSGDFSCTSDVYTKDGIRISPGSSSGMAWYDFGIIDENKIKVILQWEDNAWYPDSKELQVFNWVTNAWESKAKWSGNDGKEHIDTFDIELSKEHLDKDNKIRIGVSANPSAVIHLNSIKVTH